MRNLLAVLILAVIAAGGWIVWSYGTVEPCGILEQEARDDFVLIPEEGEVWSEEDEQDAAAMVEEAMHQVVSGYTQLECADKVLAFWFLENPYGDEESETAP